MGTSKHQNIKITYQGFTFYYRINKHQTSLQDPILFISGAFQDMNSWKPISTYFTQKTTTILVDLPGTGSADSLPSDYGFAFLSETIHHLINEIKIDKVYIISASYGTPIAYTFAQRFPNRVSKLVLAGTMTFLTNHLKKLTQISIAIAHQGNGKVFADFVMNNGLLYTKTDGAQKINKYDFVKRVLHRQLSFFNKTSLQKYIDNSNRLLRESSLDIHEAPSVKALVFTGEYDVFTTPNACKKVAESFEDSFFTTIKNADHLFHLEQTKTTIELLHKFGNNIPLTAINGCNSIQQYKKCKEVFAH